MEPVENWDNLFFDTCDIGRGMADRREGGDVIRGGSGGWLGFADGECDNTTAGGDVAGDEPGDTVEAMGRERPWDFVWVIYGVRTLGSISKRRYGMFVCSSSYVQLRRSIYIR